MIMSNRKCTFVFLVVFLLYFYPASGSSEPLDKKILPFSAGEKLTYNLRWGFIPAGKAMLAVLPETEIEGVTANHFLLTAQSNSFIDAFYKVRDQVDSYTDLGVTKTLFYTKKQLEGNTHNDIVVTFNWEGLTAQYTNFGEPKEPILIEPGSLDPLSIFFYARTLDLDVGSIISYPVTDGEKALTGQARIVKRERIKVPAGEFDTFLMIPDLKDLGGVFKKSKKAKMFIWITTDSRRILVKFRSKVIVGSFISELITIEDTRPEIQVTEN